VGAAFAHNVVGRLPVPAPFEDDIDCGAEADLDGESDDPQCVDETIESHDSGESADDVNDGDHVD
jgi:hypothetical protein